jgi:hypothetical protein
MFDIADDLKRDNRIEEIYKLFKKPSIKHAPNMERERVYSGKINVLDSDTMIYRDSELLVVRWDTINKKNEFAKGVSFYIPQDKIKISALYLENGDFVKYYCEAVEVEYKEESDKYIFRDLIVDVDVFEGGKAVVRDEDELEDALKRGIVTQAKVDEILKVRDKILYLLKVDQIPPMWCIMKAQYI